MIDTRLTRLRNYALLLLSIALLRTFVFSCYKYRCVCRPRAKKFNIVRNDHEHSQRREFSVLDWKDHFWANLIQK